jgi:integrase
VTYAQVPKMVVASVVTTDGEPMYPRKWNHDFVGLPIVNKEKQHRPTVTGSQVEDIVNRATFRFAVLFSLLAGTGLRAGEALALKPTDFSRDFRVLRVTKSIWHGVEQLPKTPAAVREIDVAEPLAALLRNYADGKTGYLFATRSARPLAHRNVHRAAGVGLHAFRRFRMSVLRKSGVPEDLIGFWLGHAGRSVTDDYARQLREDCAFRQEWRECAGLGFSIGLFGAIPTASSELQKAA